ncbi:MAG TPA: hypothetical protein PLW78_09835, partial [bacterium]|nr:hypothetical protein [bacterium]
MQKILIPLFIFIAILFTVSCGSDKKKEITDSDMESYSDEDGEAVMDTDITEPDNNIEHDNNIEPDDLVEPDETVKPDENDTEPDEITEFEDNEGLENEDDTEIDDSDMDMDEEDINFCGTENAVC